MPLEPKQRKDSPCWWIRGTVEGTPVFESTGIPHASRKRAPVEVYELCRKREKELSISGRATLGDAIAAYLEAGGSPRFLAPINENLGRYELSSINQQLIDRTAVEVYPDCTAQTRNRQFYTPFIAVWSYASMGQNAMCPPIRWGRPKGATALKQVRKPTTFEDAVKFINTCPDHAARIMFFLFWTGCRPKEALKLEARNVDLKARWAVIEDTKTGTVRGVPLHKSLLPMLRNAIKKDGRIFKTSAGEEYSLNMKINKLGRIISQGGGNFAASLKKAKKLGLEITPYTARHTVSNWLTRERLHDERDEILGHAKTVKSVYVHLPRKDLIKAIDSLPDAGRLGCKLATKVYNKCTEKKGGR